MKIPISQLVISLPNLITLSRIFNLFLIVILLYFAWRGAATVAFVLFVFGGLSDWLDGYIARRCHLISNFGKIMDALVDKIFIVGLFVTLLGMDLCPHWGVFVVLLIITREFIITGLRILAANRGILLGAEQIGKIKTIVQLLSIGAFLLQHALLVDFQLGTQWIRLVQSAGVMLFLSAAILTVISGSNYLIKYGYLLREEIVR